MSNLKRNNKNKETLPQTNIDSIIDKGNYRIKLETIEEENPKDANIRRLKEIVLFFIALIMITGIFVFCVYVVFSHSKAFYPDQIHQLLIFRLLTFPDATVEIEASILVFSIEYSSVQIHRVLNKSVFHYQTLPMLLLVSFFIQLIFNNLKTSKFSSQSNTIGDIANVYRWNNIFILIMIPN